MTDEPKPLVWTKERRTPARRAPSVDRIVRTALDIADAEGLDAVSMRRVATDLASGTASLYRYVANRDELLDLMIDAAQGDADLPGLTGDWHADLTAQARHLRTTLLRHPWLGRQLAGRPSFGPNALRRIDFVLAAAAPLTADITLASHIVDALSSYVFGATSHELAALHAQQRTGQTEDQWRATVAPYLREVIATGDYPHFARRIIDAEDATPTASFEFGLTCLLQGIGRFAPPPVG
ncbi:TetR/AcrR family transcriptional regulator C-terminal domain-containing protein [Nocardia sp. NPDC088792]|uniref:TetR/AcrR family transcriptional regulator C-terminal domain-containing protein n=1 Tax=Nocardia sp. NPDC088792 TaxID=3364332 RepID=UPI00380ADA9E